MKKSITYTTAIASMVACLTALSLPARAETVMRCSHQLPPTFHIAKVIDRWADEVEKLSNGEIDVQMFGASSLVGSKENIASVAKGSIECAFSGNFQWGKTLPVMNVTLRPYAVTDLETLAAWPTSEAAAFLDKKLRDKGVHNFAWLLTTRMLAYTSNKKPLLEPSDFEGVKIRGLNPTLDAGLAALGAAPSAMGGDKVYQALSTGVLDAGLTDIGAAWSRKYYEVQDQVVAAPLFSVFYTGYVNLDWYEGLSDNAKAAIDNAGKAAAPWAVEATNQAAGSAPYLLATKNVDVRIQTADQISVMSAKMVPAFDKAFSEATGSDGETILKLVNKINK